MKCDLRLHTGIFFHQSRSFMMEATVSLIVLTCACLVVGIYFFFVRTSKPEEKSQPQE